MLQVAEALVLRAWTSNLVSLNVGGELKQPVTPLRKFIAQELPPAGVADRQNGIASFGDGLSQQLHAWSGHSCSPEDTDGDWRTVMTAVGSGRLSHDDEVSSTQERGIGVHRIAEITLHANEPAFAHDKCRHFTAFDSIFFFFLLHV